MQTELFEPSEYLEGPGFFALLQKTPSRTCQQSYETKMLPQILTLLDPNIDTWISQALFVQRNRRAVNLRSISLCFADLDTYVIPGLKGKAPEELSALLNGFCKQEGIPAPSLTLFSGRGLQAKWLLDKALGKSALPVWNTVQVGLCKLLKDFGADNRARDVSRVLRLCRTVNTKSGEIVRIVDLSGVASCPARYDFESLQELVEERFPAKVASKSAAKILTFPTQYKPDRFAQVNWNRVCDLQLLWKMRGGVPAGMREVTLFWQLNHLLLFDPGKNAWQEAQALAGNIGKGWFTDEVSRTTLSTLYRKAQEMSHGVRVDFNGMEYPPLYTPTDEMLIDTFQITPQEERRMKTIYSNAEKVRRRREQRWAAGTTPQAKSLSRFKPWETLGISRAWWYRLKARE